MIEKIPFTTIKTEYQGKSFDVQEHASPYDIQEKVNEIIDWINDVCALNVTANMPNIDAGELAYLQKENSDLKDEKVTTMSDMKCPFCQQKLDYLAEDIYGNMYCPNCRDKNGFTYKASESIWQELIRTRKALDVAVDALKEIKDGKTPVSLGICMDINDALEQITALEQKDVK